MIATLTSKGQVTLPVEVRRKWHLAAGDRLDFICTAENRIEVVPVKTRLADLKGMLPFKRKRPVTLAEMEKAIGPGSELR